MQPQTSSPTIDHQRGKGKLLGEYYGKFLREVFPAQFEHFYALDDLLVLLRTYIVLDDFIFDNRCDTLTRRQIREQAEFALLKSKKILRENRVDPSIIDSTNLIIEQAKCSFSSTHPITSVIQKCWFVFTPLSFVSGSGELKSLVEKFLKEYLALLQIADDFQDILEDRSAPQNHNIFDTNRAISQLPAEIIQSAFFLDVCRLGAQKCDQWTRLKLPSEIARKFLAHGTQYFERLLISASSNVTEPTLLQSDYIATGSLFRSTLKPSQIADLLCSHSKEVSEKVRQSIKALRAENLHQCIQ